MTMKYTFLSDKLLTDCPECQAPLHDGHRLVGLTHQDYIVGWMCPDCGHCWYRSGLVVPGEGRFGTEAIDRILADYQEGHDAFRKRVPLD